MNESINAGDMTRAELGARLGLAEGQTVTGVYEVVCRQVRAGFEHAHAEYMRLLEGARSQVLRKWLHTHIADTMEVKWVQRAPNIVTTVGANALLDAGLAGSAYTAATYMGLISSVGYTGVPVIGDTMVSHPTWTEAGTTNAPTYTGPRKTIAWAAAANKQKVPSTDPVFAVTGTGTIKGAFIVYGTGAVSTIMSTAGVLYSAGLFDEGDQPVVATNTLTVKYTALA